MEEKVVKRIKLENGLELKICDESRKIIGDRCLVKCAALIDIPTGCIPKDQPETGDIHALLGDSVRFELRRERNFISEEEKEEVFAALCDFFLDTSLSYLSHPEFAEKYVWKKYREAVKNRR